MTQPVFPIIPQPHAWINQEQYKKMYQQSLHDPEGFWGEQAKAYLSWYEQWEKVLSGSFETLNVRWFQGGKLNASYNCLDRHLAKNGEQVALIWESDDPNYSTKLTYRELHDKVCRFANMLKRLNVKKGDRVCIYLPMIPEAAIAMLACTRIGAVHSVVFAGFSADALKTRILDAECQVVITANEGLRGNKVVPLKQNVDQALQDCPMVTNVVVVKRTENSISWNATRDYWYHELIAKENNQCEPAIMDAEDPLFILYTSGSTGKPKGIVHGTGGYLLYAAMTFKLIFDYHPNEIFWCTADVGWVTGHTYGVYGPLANAATIIFFEGIPTYPTPSRFWEVIDKHQVNIFYTAPTAIRALRREGDEWVTKTKRQSLRLLGTVGEPINAEAWEWYFKTVGESRCPLVDTWWQTETGATMISPFPAATPMKPSSASWPFFGVVPKVVDDDGEEVANDTMGKLVITQPWPGMMQTIYKDKKRFADTYFNAFPGWYVTGDLAHQDKDGYFWISGRSDDVLKISGHRIGTQEIESACVLHPAVAEAAVVGKTDPVKGQSIYAYITLKKGFVADKNLRQEIITTVRQAIGPIATPENIQWSDGLPKTRSGKIMRRILRKIADNEVEDLGDLSTLADPGVVDELIKEREKIG